MKSKPQSKKMLYIKLASLDDLCRYVCNFDYTNSSIMSLRTDERAYRIFSPGEEIDGTLLAYYVNSTGKEPMLSYTYPSSGGQAENSHFVERMGSASGSYYMNITSIAGANFRESRKGMKVMPVQLSEPSDLINAVIRRAVKSESMSHIYSFSHKGRRVFCAFDAIEELQGEERMLYYSISEKPLLGNFARYKYSENKVDFTDYVGEHSYIYVKIINLAEPFPFLKLPD